LKFLQFRDITPKIHQDYEEETAKKTNFALQKLKTN